MSAEINHTKSIGTNEAKELRDGVTDAAWDGFYSHLQDGYRNAQETIRAMDTKVSILTGLSVFTLTVAGGILGSAANCFGDHPEYFRIAVMAPPSLLVMGALLALSIFVSLALGIICISSCLGTLHARNRIDGLTDLPATILFPHLHPRGELTTAQWLGSQRLAKAYYDRIVVREFTAADLQKEYHDQILNVAAILGEKVVHFQRASHWFRRQMVLTGVVLALLLLTMIGIGIAQRYACNDPKRTKSNVSIQEIVQPMLQQAP